MVWEHGTVGAGDECAPSKNPIHPRFKILANTLIGGRLCNCVHRDYEGFRYNREFIHTLIYPVRQILALTAVKAAKEHYGKQLEWSVDVDWSIARWSCILRVQRNLPIRMQIIRGQWQPHLHRV